MKFKFLVENKTDHPDIMAEHGLSIYIEAHGKKILFDAGATDLLIQNAKAMEVKLKEADLAVVSHGHYDHTGGFPAFCRINPIAPIYLHKNGLRRSYGLEQGQLEQETCGIRWTEEERRDMKGRLVFTDGPKYIEEDICITGTVPYAPRFTPTERFYYRDETGELTEDDMSHEQCLVVREEEGLYIFSGCSHRGAVSSLQAGMSMYPGERVALLVAGMHLYSASEEDRRRTVEEISGENVSKIMPVHCTGIKAICDLKTSLKDRCIVAVAGDVFDEC